MSLEMRSTFIPDFGYVDEIMCPKCGSSNQPEKYTNKCWVCHHMFIGPINYVLTKVMARFSIYNRFGVKKE